MNSNNAINSDPKSFAALRFLGPVMAGARRLFVLSDRIVILVFVLATCGLGLLRIFKEKNRISDCCTLAVEFMEHLKAYVRSRGSDLESYGWLMHRSNKMQSQLGLSGIYASYRPPYANFQYSNYPIVLNMLPDLRHALDDSILSNSPIVHQYSMALQDTLVRHLGSLHDQDERNNRALRNPVVWLREGVRVVVALPLTMLGWLGAIGESTVSRLLSSRIFKAVSAFVAVVGFISAVMGITLGWDQFIQMVLAWFHKAF